MSSLRIYRTDQISSFIEFNPEAKILEKEFLEKVSSLFTLFKEEQNILQGKLNFSLSHIFLDRRNQETLAFLKHRFTVPFAQDQMLLIFKICTFIKSQPFFTKDQINRYKIEGFCSISILSNTADPSLDDTIFVHMKKKHLATIMGRGARSKATKAIEFSNRQFSLVAEKTTYSSMIKKLNCTTLHLNPALFVHPPLVDYFYYQEKHKSEACEIEKKHCSLEKLFDLTLIEIIVAHQNTPFLTEAAVWNISMKLIEIIKNLHDRNLIYRDLKPDNILVSLDKSQGSFDFNKFSLVAADLDTVTQEGFACEQWYGTPSYFPEDISRERQGKPYDVYVLGQILASLFDNHLETKFYIFEIFSIISSMRSEDFTQRPTIDEVRKIFLLTRPAYLSLSEETIDCISLLDCVIS